MDYLTDTDSVILLAGSLGLAIGLLISVQELGLDWWLKKEWLGWDRAISRSVVSAIVWALLMGAIAFLSVLYEPMKAIADIKSQTLSWGIFIGLSLPITTRFGLWAAEKLGQMMKSNQL